MKHAFAIALTAAVLLCVSCKSGGVAESYLTVEEFIPRIAELDGKTVTVAGYLGECAGYNCVLFVDQAGQMQFNHWAAELRKMKRQLDHPEPPIVGIGSSSWDCKKARSKDCIFEFDRKAAPFTNGFVLITGRVTNKCRDEEGRPGCTDRTTDLFPTEIKPWNPPQRTASGSAE